jgi:Skp family chaperone for outer membrane proteins
LIGEINNQNFMLKKLLLILGLVIFALPVSVSAFVNTNTNCQWVWGVWTCHTQADPFSAELEQQQQRAQEQKQEQQRLQDKQNELQQNFLDSQQRLNDNISNTTQQLLLQQQQQEFRAQLQERAKQIGNIPVPQNVKPNKTFTPLSPVTFERPQTLPIKQPPSDNKSFIGKIWDFLKNLF